MLSWYKQEVIKLSTVGQSSELFWAHHNLLALTWAQFGPDGGGKDKIGYSRNVSGPKLFLCALVRLNSLSASLTNASRCTGQTEQQVAILPLPLHPAPLCLPSWVRRAKSPHRAQREYTSRQPPQIPSEPFHLQ